LGTYSIPLRAHGGRSSAAPSRRLGFGGQPAGTVVAPIYDMIVTSTLYAYYAAV